MEIAELYKKQKELDARIIKDKNLYEIDLLPKLTLALLVELGELANEWRGFKFWSLKQHPRFEIECHACKGKGKFSEDEPCLLCEETGIQARPLVEEYVDCLHFFLSIANRLNLPETDLYVWDDPLEDEVERIFIELKYHVAMIEIEESINKVRNFRSALYGFIQLGIKLGFDWESDIIPEYIRKNKINHQRQNDGY